MEWGAFPPEPCGSLSSLLPSEAQCAFSVPYLNRELKGQKWTKEACFACPTCWAVVLALFSEGGWGGAGSKLRNIEKECKLHVEIWIIASIGVPCRWVCIEKKFFFLIHRSFSDRWCWKKVHGAGWQTRIVECPDEALSKHLVNWQKVWKL